MSRHLQQLFRCREEYRFNTFRRVFFYIPQLQGIIVDVANFSYKCIDVGETVVIPACQQMVLCGQITIDGELIIDGEVCLI